MVFLWFSYGLPMVSHYQAGYPYFYTAPPIQRCRPAAGYPISVDIAAPRACGVSRGRQVALWRCGKVNDHPIDLWYFNGI